MTDWSTVESGTPEGKICSGCMRFEERWRESEKGTYHCCRQDYRIDKFPDDIACEEYWDRAEYEAEERRKAEETEKERQRKWAIYSKKPPVKLPIVFDGYGKIPECPICGDVPYSTKQCYWCGQRFIQDEEIKDYNKPDECEIKCPICGGKMVGIRAKYNGHFHGQCKDCGVEMHQ